MGAPISIQPFSPHLAPAFTELNRAWIERLFRIEESDWKVLRDPEAAIVRPGGQIFFAIENGIPVATAAAIHVTPAVYELAKMAVTPSHQRRGLGELVGRAVIDWTRAAGAERLFLETNSSLANAIRLYERLGFVHAVPPRASAYARSDVYMELRFKDQ